MTRWIGLSCWLALAWAMGSGLPGQGAVPSQTDWGQYEIVVQRNIFDPSRRPPQADRGPTPTPVPPPETLDLTGVLVQPSGPLAFFEGSKTSGSKAVKEGQELQGLRLGQIRTQAVLASDGPTSLTLRVGARLARPEDGSWRVVPRPVAAAAPTSAPSASTATRKGSSTARGASAQGAARAAGETPVSSTSDLEGLTPAERLRERRRREMGQ